MKLTPLNSTALPASTQTAGLLVVATATTIFLLRRPLRVRKLMFCVSAAVLATTSSGYAYKDKKLAK
ncbi:hypothetical protein [Lactobacillus amylovorus]|uniref:hypothetical protein n=1 Tax=Lactobacillus amylovorus TaxID=1604 RepID=UPI00232D144E|nr:hypothetical protein [Lactobacillus amylovorus]